MSETIRRLKANTNSNTVNMSSVADLGLGKVGKNSHPIHPATVHLPIAFLLTSSAFNILSFVIFQFPSLFHPLVKLFSSPYTSTSTVALIYYLSQSAHYLNILGILSAVPALSSGLFEGYSIISRKGLDLSNPLVKTTLMHAGLNDLAIVAAIGQWVSGRKEDRFFPSGGKAILGAGIFAAIAYAGFLGGALVYTHGAGVQRMGIGKAERNKEVALEREEGRQAQIEL